MAQEQGRPLQTPGIELLGSIDQDRLCLCVELLAELARAPGNKSRMAKADRALRKRCLGLRKGSHLSRNLDMLRSRGGGEIALPAQPGLGGQRLGWGITLVVVEVMQPPAGLGINAIADASQAFEVIANRLCRNHTKILGTEQIENAMQLADELLRGPIPPHPTLRTHVRIIPSMCLMSS